MHKPFSQSCENNKKPILQIIQRVFSESKVVWEIGSGTGQHACFFAENLPHLIWQTSDRQENMAGINSWVEETELSNLPLAIALNVLDKQWPCQKIEALFTANTMHIMHWQVVQYFFAGLGRYLADQATVCIYGPFNYQGKYTSASNAQFDQWLKSVDPQQGIRDFADIENLAKQADLVVKEDISMPANNHLLVLKKLCC